jgi:peptidoglycan/LPS O-acetylase OafA/YrhL
VEAAPAVRRHGKRIMIQSRQKHLDSLRGVAAVIVVISHFFTVFYPYTVFGAQGTYAQKAFWEDLFFYPPFGMAIAGYFAVSIFFILSGYVLSYAFLGEKGVKVNIVAATVKRPFRLGGLVLASVIAGASLWCGRFFFNGTVATITGAAPWFSSFWNGEFSLHDFIRNAFCSLFSSGITYNPPLWTIKLELYGSFLVFGFLFFFGSLRYRLCILTVLLVVFHRSLYQGFVFGILLADLHKNYAGTLPSRIGRYAVLPALLLAVYFSSYPFDVSGAFRAGTIYAALPKLNNVLGGGYSMLGALLTFILVDMLPQAQEHLRSRLFLFLGKISYGLYAIHFLVIGSFSSWLFLHLRVHLGYASSFLAVFIISLPLMLGLAYLLTKYIDEPFIALASRIGKITGSMARHRWVGPLFERFEKITEGRST